MKSLFWIITSLIAVHAAVPIVHAADLNIITPQNLSLVSSKQIILVLEQPRQGFDEIRVEVNDKRKITRKGLSGNRFLCWGNLPLEHGINQIKVTAIRSGRVAGERQLSVFRQALRSRLSKNKYKRADFHKRKKEKLCAACHEIGTDPPDQTACFACHGVMNAGSYVHEPTVTSCLTCHNPKIPLGTQTERELCSRCHMYSMDEWTAKRYEHGPMALGYCTACHDPHASGQARMLREDATGLCLECHDEFETKPHLLTTFSGNGHPIRRPSNPARPEEAFSCASCHNPHAGNSPVFIDQYVDGTRLQFCVSCHNLR